MRAFHCFCLPRRSQARQAGHFPIRFSSEIESCGPAHGLVDVTASGSVATREQVKSRPHPPTPLFTRVTLTQTGTICRQCRQQGEHQASSEP